MVADVHALKLCDYPRLQVNQVWVSDDHRGIRLCALKATEKGDRREEVGKVDLPHKTVDCNGTYCPSVL